MYLIDEEKEIVIKKPSNLLGRRSITAILFLAIAFTTFIGDARPAYAKITFQAGWNDPQNSDICPNDDQTRATQALKTPPSPPSLKKAIESSKCLISVAKGCHQRNDPHFTVSEKAQNCNVEPWAGTRNVHVLCQPCQ